MLLPLLGLRSRLLPPVALLALGLLLAGCGGGGGGNGGTGGGPGAGGPCPDVTAGPAQATGLPADTAISSFAAYRKCFDDDSASFHTAVQAKCALTGGDLAACKAALAAWLSRVNTFADELAATPWPVAARGVAQGTAANLRQYSSAMSQMQKADQPGAIGQAVTGTDPLLQVIKGQLDQVQSVLAARSTQGGVPASLPPASGGPPSIAPASGPPVSP